MAGPKPAVLPITPRGSDSRLGGSLASQFDLLNRTRIDLLNRTRNFLVRFTRDNLSQLRPSTGQNPKLPVVSAYFMPSREAGDTKIGSRVSKSRIQESLGGFR